MAEETGQTEETQAEPETKPEPLTMDAVKKMIQSETDRVRTEYVQKLKESEAEKEELKKAQMDEAERLRYEKEAAEKRAADIEARQKELELDNAITTGLAEKKLDTTVKALTKGIKTKDEAETWFETLNTVIDRIAEARVNERLAGKPPQSGGDPKPPKTLETFKDAQNASEADFLAYLNQAVTGD